VGLAQLPGGRRRECNSQPRGPATPKIPVNAFTMPIESGSTGSKPLERPAFFFHQDGARRKRCGEFSSFAQDRLRGAAAAVPGVGKTFWQNQVAIYVDGPDHPGKCFTPVRRVHVAPSIYKQGALACRISAILRKFGVLKIPSVEGLWSINAGNVAAST